MKSPTDAFCLTGEFFLNPNNEKTTAQDQHKSWFENNPRKTIFSFIAFFCLLLLLGAEFASRIIIPEWAPAGLENRKFLVYDRLLGWANEPNQKEIFHDLDFTIEVRINSYGLRDREYILQRTEKKRLLIVGDSMGWGWGVEQNERFSEILEEMYENWEIINASVIGYGTDQEFLYLRERGMDFQPDVVLLLFHPNDFLNNSAGEQYLHYKPFFSIGDNGLIQHNRPVPNSSIDQIIKRLIERTYFFKRVIIVLGDYGKRLKVYLSRLQSDFAGAYRSEHRETSTNSGEAARLERGFVITTHLPGMMSKVASLGGACLAVVSVPMQSHYREVLRQAAKDHNFLYLPLDPYFDVIEESVKFPRDIQHWNARGHQVAAMAIEKFLNEHGILNGSHRCH